jgi:hypothetical protein
VHAWLAPLLALVFSAPPAEEVKAVARRILEDPAYQKRIEPPAPPPGSAIRPDGGGRAVRPVPPRDPEEDVDPAPRRDSSPSGDGGSDASDSGRGGGSDFGKALLWVLLGVVLVVAVLQVWQGFRGYGRRAAAAPEARAGPGPALAAAALRRPLSAAEALAGLGRYAEAIHALLLQTLSTLVAHAEVAVPASLTSREILAKVPLADAPRQALAGIVHVAEVSHFGGRVPEQAEWLACVERFRRFTDALAPGAA